MPTAMLGLGGVLGFAALVWVFRREQDRFIARAIVLGLLAKVVGTGVFYWVLEDVYGSGDANRYFRVGSSLAPLIRSGTMPDQASMTGTPFMEFLAGVVIALTGPNKFLAFLVFGLLSYSGMYLFLQAFRRAFPEGDHRRYALLVLFLPTMVFWPSSLGKEAWLVFTLGLASYGAARTLRGSVIGYPLAAAGVLGMFAIRPHMGALFALSLAAAYTVRLRDKSARTNMAAWVVGMVVISGGALYVLIDYSDEFSAEDEEAEAADSGGGVLGTTDQLLERTGEQTATGGSEFASRPVRGPADFLHGMVTVPLRPFPFEAHNRAAQIASFEGVLVLLLVLTSLTRLRGLLRTASRRPYVMMAVVYCTGFIIAFSNFSNFGILTRQRPQLFPFLAVLLALPAAKRGIRILSTEDPSRAKPAVGQAGPLILVTPQRPDECQEQVSSDAEPRRAAPDRRPTYGAPLRDDRDDAASSS
jgi:hypothetical protein